MNMDTVAALGLLGKLTQISLTVNTTSGQNMGAPGDVKVNFKIGSIHSHIGLWCVKTSPDQSY